MKKSFRLHRARLGIVLALSLCVAVPGATLAIEPPVPLMDFSSTIHIDMAVSNSLAMQQRNLASRGRSATAPRNSNAQSAENTANAYRYSHNAAIAREVNNTMVQNIRQTLQQNQALTPAIEQQLQQLGAADLLGEVRQALRQDGYQPDSIATAMSFWIVVNYGIAEQADLSRLRGHALVQQFESVLGNDAGIASLSVADKQRMADTLYWAGSLQIGLYLQAANQGDAAQIRQRVEAARAALSAIGVNGRIRNNANALSLG